MHLDENNNLFHTETCVWEAIVMLSNKDDCIGKPYKELQRQLGKSACLSGQEIGITPTKEGWIIHICACWEGGGVDILIPQDRNKPVQILKDTRAISEYQD